MDTLAVKIIIFSVATCFYLIQIIGIPGNFAGVLAALAYLLFSDLPLGWGRVILFLVLALSGEAMDALMGLLGARKYGASKKGMMAAGLGGFAGAILGGMIIPVIGSIIGVFLGIFILTFITEYRLEEKEVSQAGKAGWGAVLGRLLALAYKYAVGLIILIMLAFLLF
jgi:uncharacterized protein YqgC (DUF456 family)